MHGPINIGFTHLMFNNFSPRKSCCLWENMEKYCGARRATYVTIIRRMRLACWVTKAICSEYLILFAFPLQQWLRERPVLSITCLFSCTEAAGVLFFVRGFIWHFRKMWLQCVPQKCGYSAYRKYPRVNIFLYINSINSSVFVMQRGSVFCGTGN